MNLNFAAATCLLVALSAGPLLAQKSSTPETSAVNGSLSSLDSSKIRLDVSKSGIESPVERLVEQSTPTPMQPPGGNPRPVDDQSKMLIESNLEALVDRASESGVSDPPLVSEDDNPACQPGLVSWHDSFETACAAARDSGKPVLLFQLLGRLDQRFT